MKVKYYIRGVGVGILFTMFIFLVIIIPNMKLNDKMTADKEETVQTESDLGKLLGARTGGEETPEENNPGEK